MPTAQRCRDLQEYKAGNQWCRRGTGTHGTHLTHDDKCTDCNEVTAIIMVKGLVVHVALMGS